MQDPASPPATSQQAAGHEMRTTFRAALLAPTDTPSNTSPSENRDRFFDNAKALLLFMVVADHFRVFGGISPCTLPIDSSLQILSATVMPCFSFISGHLTAPTLTRPRVARLVTMTFVLCCWNAAYTLEKKYTAAATLTLVNKETKPKYFATLQKKADSPLVPLNLLSRHDVTWYLLGLIVWRATLPALLLLRRPLLIVSLLAMAGPYTDLGSSSVSTVLGFWPFFIAGHLVPREKLIAWRTSRKLRSAYICSVFALIPATALGFSFKCLYGEGFDGGGPVCRDPMALLSLAFSYPICTFSAIGFFTLIPRRKVWGLSLAGRLSMYAYLLHPLFVTGALTTHLMHHVLQPKLGCGALGWLYVALTLVIWAVLSSPLARLLCWPCVEPPIAKVCCVPEAIDGEIEGEGEQASVEEGRQPAVGSAELSIVQPLPPLAQQA